MTAFHTTLHPCKKIQDCISERQNVKGNSPLQYLIYTFKYFSDICIICKIINSNRFIYFLKKLL